MVNSNTALNRPSLRPQRTGVFSCIVETARRYYSHKYLFLLLLPALIFYTIFHYAPIYGVLIAFKDYKFSKGVLGSEWVGFEHFRQMFSGDSFTSVLYNTIVLSMMKLVVCFPAPIIFAMLLNEIRRNRFKKVVQTVSYLPHFLSWVILSGIIIQMLSPSIGPVGYILSSLGITPPYFMADSRWFRYVLVFTSLWKELGWSTIVYLAGMSNVNSELYDAASVDGAGRFRKAINVTLPALVPIITFVFIMSIGSIINDDFDQILNLSNPAVMQVADVISTYTYNVGLVMMNYSYGTAVGLFKNVIALALVIITNFTLKKISDNEYSIF